MPRRGTAGFSPWYAFVSFLRVKKGNARRGTACPEGVSRAPKGYERQKRKAPFYGSLLYIKKICIITLIIISKST